MKNRKWQPSAAENNGHRRKTHAEFFVWDSKLANQAPDQELFDLVNPDGSVFNVSDQGDKKLVRLVRPVTTATMVYANGSSATVSSVRRENGGLQITVTGIGPSQLGSGEAAGLLKS